MNSDPASVASPQCTIAPWLSVWSGARAIAFYKAAFGATEAYYFDGPEGSVVARLSVDGAEFWLSGEGESPELANRTRGHRKKARSTEARFE
jgi:PhnB protein